MVFLVLLSCDVMLRKSLWLLLIVCVPMLLIEKQLYAPSVLAIQLRQRDKSINVPLNLTMIPRATCDLSCANLCTVTVVMDCFVFWPSASIPFI